MNDMHEQDPFEPEFSTPKGEAPAPSEEMMATVHPVFPNAQQERILSENAASPILATSVSWHFY